MTISDEPDKNDLYGQYRKHENWKHALHRRAVHKALDMMPEDDVNIDASRQSTSGLGWKELAVIGALGLGGTGLYLNSQQTTSETKTETVQQPAPQPVQPLPDGEQEFEIRFYNADGELVRVPHVSQMKPKGD